MLGHTGATAGTGATRVLAGLSRHDRAGHMTGAILADTGAEAGQRLGGMYTVKPGLDELELTLPDDTYTANGPSTELTILITEK